MSFFRRGGIEPPPPEYRGRGPAPGTKTIQLKSRQEVDEACRAEGIGPSDFARMNGKTTLGCYSPKSSTIYIIEPSQMPADEWAELSDHENAHSWGLIHDGHGEGWKPAPPGPAQPLTFDWSQALNTKRMFGAR